MKRVASIFGVAILLFSGCQFSTGQAAPPTSDEQSSSPIQVLPDSTSSFASSSNAESSVFGMTDDSIFPVPPAKANTPPTEMDDSDLINLFQNTIYRNGYDVFMWFYGRSEGLELAADAVRIADDGYTGLWWQILNVGNLEALKRAMQHVYSRGYMKQIIIPRCLDGNDPIIREVDGELYVFPGGSSSEQKPDFSSAVVHDKNEHGFTVDIPMTNPDSSIYMVFPFEVVEQDGVWVLASFYLFDPDVPQG